MDVKTLMNELKKYEGKQIVKIYDRDLSKDCQINGMIEENDVIKIMISSNRGTIRKDAPIPLDF